MARSIAGLFPDRGSAEQAIGDLKNAGFDPAKIGIVLRDKSEAREVADEQGTHSTEGAVAGGLIGGSLGAILVAVGALAIPGIGPVISGGVLASLVGGTAGWLVGGLAGLGIPEDEARYYEDQVHQGRALVTVDAGDREPEARAILIRDGAQNFQDDAYPATTGATTTASDVAYNASGANTGTVVDDANADIRIPVREEELVVGKRRIEEGHVHIHKDVVEEPETVNVRTQQERISVERVPFSGDAGDADAFKERDIDVPVMGEEIVTGKRIAGVEELRLHKDVVTEREQISDTVRKERVVVDGLSETDASPDTGYATERDQIESRGSTTGDR